MLSSFWKNFVLYGLSRVVVVLAHRASRTTVVERQMKYCSVVLTWLCATNFCGGVHRSCFPGEDIWSIIYTRTKTPSLHSTATKSTQEGHAGRLWWHRMAYISPSVHASWVSVKFRWRIWNGVLKMLSDVERRKTFNCDVCVLLRCDWCSQLCMCVSYSFSHSFSGSLCAFKRPDRQSGVRYCFGLL